MGNPPPFLFPSPDPIPTPVPLDQPTPDLAPGTHQRLNLNTEEEEDLRGGNMNQLANSPYAPRFLLLADAGDTLESHRA